MGSSGSTNYQQPPRPTPPNVAEYGSSVPFQPNFMSFLGDTNVPHTGLTPEMLAAIDSGSYAQQPVPSAPSGGGDRGLLAGLMAQLSQRTPARTPMGAPPSGRLQMGTGYDR